MLDQLTNYVGVRNLEKKLKVIVAFFKGNHFKLANKKFVLKNIFKIF